MLRLAQKVSIWEFFHGVKVISIGLRVISIRVKTSGAFDVVVGTVDR